MYGKIHRSHRDRLGTIYVWLIWLDRSRTRRVHYLVTRATFLAPGCRYFFEALFIWFDLASLFFFDFFGISGIRGTQYNFFWIFVEFALDWFGFVWPSSRSRI